MTTFSRRGVLGVGAALGAAALGVSMADSAEAAIIGGGRAPEETKSLDELYADALDDGGELIIYAGGDTPDQQAGTVQAFLARFPEIKLTMVVDYSKFHDVRVDNQLATGTLVPDLVWLQTMQDFTRWKKLGVLRPYKPAGFSKVHPSFKDPDGAWVATTVINFSFMYDVAAAGSGAPTTPHDLADPRWKDAIASGYPHDDDALLYLYVLYAQTYGWDWIARLAAQNIQFARGSHSGQVAVAMKQKVIGVPGVGSPVGPPLIPGTRLVAADGHPFMAWGQRGAILAGAKNPASAKLYLNWQLSLPVQQNSFTGWSVRTDVTPPSGLKPIWHYPNAHLDGFPRFMADRAEVERWKQTFAVYFGEVQGAPTPGWLGLHPGR